LRLPRVIAALLAGASLGLAGAVLQGLTRERSLITLVVLHDLNLALRFADRFLLLGPEAAVSTGSMRALGSEAVRSAYGIDVIRGEVGGHPVMVPCVD
jgi:iron complex transport system ATP-binding protein